MLIISFKKNKILITSVAIMMVTVSQVSASIYHNNFSKSGFILNPLSLQSTVYQNNGIGGAEYNISDSGVVEPNDFFFEIEEDTKTIEDIKQKDNIQYYIVQSGDNVAKIAKKFGISQSTII
jgi:LysM repeat protein